MSPIIPQVPVPVPDAVAILIGRQMPAYVVEAEIAAERALIAALNYRPLDCSEDRADREDVLARMARANKVLAAYNPGLIVRHGGAR